MLFVGNFAKKTAFANANSNFKTAPFYPAKFKIVFWTFEKRSESDFFGR
jgi:hypothetical protein